MTERRSFFAELKRRNVYKVAVAYAIVGWLIVQIATQVFPFLEIPNWVVRLVIILVAIGFPMALIIAWAFELTPEGIKRTGDVDRSAQDTSTNRIWVYVAVIGAALAVGLFLLDDIPLEIQLPDMMPVRLEPRRLQRLRRNPSPSCLCLTKVGIPRTNIFLMGYRKN